MHILILRKLAQWNANTLDFKVMRAPAHGDKTSKRPNLLHLKNISQIKVNEAEGLKHWNSCRWKGYIQIHNIMHVFMMKMCAKLPQDYSKTFQMLWLGGKKKEEVTNLGWCCPNRRTSKSEYAWIIPGTKILPEWLLAAGMEWRPDASSYFEFPRLLLCVFAHEVLDGLNMEEWFLRGEEQCEYSIIIHKRTILKWGNCLALQQQFCIIFSPATL